MKELVVLCVFTFVSIQTISGEGIEFPGRVSPYTVETQKSTYISCQLKDDTPNYESAVYHWHNNKGTEVTTGNSDQHYYVRPITNGKRLYINSIVDDDTGSYLCSAIVGTQTYNKTIQLDVRASLTFANCKVKQDAVLGKPAQIFCSASAGGSFVETSWEKSGQSLDGMPAYRIESGSLKILEVTKQNAGIYKFTALSPWENDDREITVRITETPKILQPILQKTAVVGNPTEMFCKSSGVPLPEIEWRKKGTTNKLETGGRIKVTPSVVDQGTAAQSILEINPVERTDEADYTCTAKNTAGNVTEGSLLTVHSPPTISDMSDAQGTEDGGAEIRCESRGDPVPKMVWQKEDSDVQYADGHNADDISVSRTMINDPNNPGAILTIQFSKLRYTDAGLYRCTATNKAGTTNKTAKLEVRFKPNFDNQETGPFYTWTNNQNAVVPCVARGNKQPVFTWYKDNRKIAASDSAYSINRVEDPDDEFLVTSKLTVSYDGANDAVFGDYTCSAKNSIGETEQILQLMKADRPGQPTVDMNLQSATKLIFWLYEPTGIRGPPVTNFKVVYKIQGSSDQALTKVVAREHRPQIDFGRKYSIIELVDLKPSSSYVFTFYAISPVGDGQPLERQIQTPAISVPGIVRFVEDTTNHANSDHASQLLVRWIKPTTGGAVILKYQLTYQRVNVKTNGSSNPAQGYELNNPITESVLVDNIKDTSKVIKGLIPGSYYQVKVTAINQEGAGTAGVKIFKMKEAPLDPGASTGNDGSLSTGAIIGIVIAIFVILFIIVDVTCYFKNNCGILMSIHEKVGARGEDGYSAAKTDDVENLAKKDELTEEAKAAEEGDTVAPVDDEKKEPLLSSEEQKVDTVDETNTKPEEKELEPEEKEVIKTPPESPKVEETPPAPAVVEETPKPESPTQPEQPSSDKPQE